MAFSNVATVLGVKSADQEATLVRATIEGIQELKEKVKSTSPDLGTTGGTDFRVGFDKAFEVLISSVEHEQIVDVPPSSGCEKVGDLPSASVP